MRPSRTPPRDIYNFERFAENWCAGLLSAFNCQPFFYKKLLFFANFYYTNGKPLSSEQVCNWTLDFEYTCCQVANTFLQILFNQ